jgi:hypothetical protein
MIPLLFRLTYTVFVVVLVAIWLKYYGWRNLLWFSDIALVGAVPALWLEDAQIASVLAVAVLLPEMLWNVDLAGRVMLRRRISGLTDYMFEQDRPLLLRRLSLFHVPLPLVLLWLLAAYGYAEPIALPGAALLAAVTLPLSRAVSSPEKNINWSWGLGPEQSRLPAPAYILLLYLGFVLLVFVPTHAILRNTFP